jgi:hypothetical protein
MKIYIAILTLSFSLLIVENTYGQVLSEAWDRITEVPKDEAVDLSSYYEAYLTNMIAWETGDVLVRIVSIYDSTGIVIEEVGDLVIEEVQTFRIKFDHPNQNLLCYKSYATEVPLAVQEDVGELDVRQKEKYVKAITYSPNGSYVRGFPGETLKLKKKYDIGWLFKEFKIPRLRTVGVVTFGSAGDFEHLQQVIPRLATSDGISRVNQESSSRIKVTRSTRMPGTDETAFISMVTFNMNSFMPESYVIDVESVRDGDRNRSRSSSEQIEWGEIDGVMVPTSISQDAGYRQRRIVDIDQVVKQLDFESLKNEDIAKRAND